LRLGGEGGEKKSPRRLLQPFAFHGQQLFDQTSKQAPKKKKGIPDKDRIGLRERVVSRRENLQRETRERGDLIFLTTEPGKREEKLKYKLASKKSRAWPKKKGKRWVLGKDERILPRGNDH